MTTKEEAAVISAMRGNAKEARNKKANTRRFRRTHTLFYTTAANIVAALTFILSAFALVLGLVDLFGSGQGGLAAATLPIAFGGLVMSVVIGLLVEVSEALARILFRLEINSESAT